MLKSLLRLLLSRFFSKQESELVGHQAMPSQAFVALTPSKTTVSDWSSVYQGVAPTDGYASATFKATSDFCLGSANAKYVVSFSSPKISGDIVTVSCPVAKGAPFSLAVRNATEITCLFVKTIGGGITILGAFFCKETCYVA